MELCFSENYYDIETSQIICFASGWLFNNTLRIYTGSYFQTDLIKFLGQVFQVKYELFWNGGKSKYEFDIFDKQIIKQIVKQFDMFSSLRPRQTCQTFCQTSVFDKCLTGFP